MDNTVDTQSYMLQWLPTTGEFGLYGTFGDFDDHQKLATRLAVHYTHSTEDKQSQPGTNGIENSQIRLTDGSVIFTPDLFGPGIAVNRVKYRMSSVDGGLKYKGAALEAEYYWRWLSDFQGSQVGGIADITDHGYQVQLSAMALYPSRSSSGNSSAVERHLAKVEVAGSIPVSRSKFPRSTQFRRAVAEVEGFLRELQTAWIPHFGAVKATINPGGRRVRAP